MSSIVWDITRKEATVAVDTLCTDDIGEPRNFVSKALVVPHLNALIAVTGRLEVLEIFFAAINNSALRGPSDLRHKAQAILGRIWAEKVVASENPVRPGGRDITTSIFQFGVSEESGEMEGFMFHSGDGFAPQQLEYGSSYKPPCKLIGEPANGDQWIAQVMGSQLHHQEQFPPAQRVHIGGEIIVFELGPGSTSTRVLCRFDDYSEARRRIFGAFT